MNESLMDYLRPWLERVNTLHEASDKMADYPTDIGKSGFWYYRKWASGMAEIWTDGKQTFNAGDSGTSTLGYDNSYQISLPFPMFVNHISGVSHPATNWGVLSGVNIHPTEMVTTVDLLTSGNNDSLTVNAELKVVGLWKNFDATLGNTVGNITSNTTYPLEDTGWQDITLQNGFLLPSSSFYAKYRKIGNIVEVRCCMVRNVATGTSWLAFGSIPYFPQEPLFTYFPAYSNCNAYVKNNGELGVAFNTSLSANNSIAVQFMFMV